MLHPSIVKTIANTTELVTILGRLERGISLSLQELNTGNACQIQEQQLSEFVLIGVKS